MNSGSQTKPPTSTPGEKKKFRMFGGLFGSGSKKSSRSSSIASTGDGVAASASDAGDADREDANTSDTRSCRTESECSSASHLTESGISMGMGKYQFKLVMQRTKSSKSPGALKNNSSRRMPQKSSSMSTIQSTESSNVSTQDSSRRVIRSSRSISPSAVGDADKKSEDGFPLPHMLLIMFILWVVCYGFLLRNNANFDWTAVSADLEHFAEFLFYFACWYVGTCASSSVLMTVLGLSRHDAFVAKSVWLHRAMYGVTQLSQCLLAACLLRLVVAHLNDRKYDVWLAHVLWLCCVRQSMALVMKMHSLYCEYDPVVALERVRPPPTSPVKCVTPPPSHNNNNGPASPTSPRNANGTVPPPPAVQAPIPMIPGPTPTVESLIKPLLLGNLKFCIRPALVFTHEHIHLAPTSPLANVLLPAYFQLIGAVCTVIGAVVIVRAQLAMALLELVRDGNAFVMPSLESTLEFALHNMPSLLPLILCMQFVCLRVGCRIFARVAEKEKPTKIFDSTPTPVSPIKAIVLLPHEREDWWSAKTLLVFCSRWNCWAMAWHRRYLLHDLLIIGLPEWGAVFVSGLFAALCASLPLMYWSGACEHRVGMVCWIVCVVLFATLITVESVTIRPLLELQPTSSEAGVEGDTTSSGGSGDAMSRQVSEQQQAQNALNEDENEVVNQNQHEHERQVENTPLRVTVPPHPTPSGSGATFTAPASPTSGSGVVLPSLLVPDSRRGLGGVVPPGAETSTATTAATQTQTHGAHGPPGARAHGNATTYHHQHSSNNVARSTSNNNNSNNSHNTNTNAITNGSDNNDNNQTQQQAQQQKQVSVITSVKKWIADSLRDVLPQTEQTRNQCAKAWQVLVSCFLVVTASVLLTVVLASHCIKLYG